MPKRNPIQALINALIEEIRRITERMEFEHIPVKQWLEVMRALIARYSVAAMMLGQGSPVLSKAARTAVKHYVGIQFAFLDNFALVIQNAEAWENGWNSRAESYAAAIKQPYWQGKTKMLPLPAMPAEGTQCHNNCGCEWEIQEIDGKAGDYDAYWRRSKDDSCQTCLERERLWNPLEIRGGMLQIPKSMQAKEPALKHLLGQHDQMSHGNRGGAPRFESVEEADAWIRGNLAYETADLELVPLDMTQDFVDEFYAMRVKHDLPMLTRIQGRAMSGETAIAQFSTNDLGVQILSINKYEIERIEAEEKMSLADYLDKVHQSEIISGGSLRDVAYHEAVHYYWYSRGSQEGDEALDRAWNLARASGYIQNISAYAEKSSTEFLSELAVHLRYNSIDTVPKNIQNLIGNYLP